MSKNTLYDLTGEYLMLWFLFLSVHIMDYPGCRFLVHQ